MPGRYGHPTSFASAIVNIDERHQTRHSSHILIVSAQSQSGPSDAPSGGDAAARVQLQRRAIIRDQAVI
jgi:hypothetical protein